MWFDGAVTRPPRLGSRQVRTELALLAFMPAFALLAIRSRETWVWVALVVPMAVGLIVAVGLVIVVRRANPEPFVFTTVEDAGDEVLGHVGSYLLPVIVDPSEGTGEMVIAAVVLALIVFIHIVTGRVHVNPLVYLVGYRIYTATSDDVAYYMLARSDPADWSATQAVTCAQVGASVLVERRGARLGIPSGEEA